MSLLADKDFEQKLIDSNVKSGWGDTFFFTKLPDTEPYKNKPMNKRLVEDMTELLALYIQNPAHLKEYLNQYNPNNKYVESDKLFAFVENSVHSWVSGGVAVAVG